MYPSVRFRRVVAVLGILCAFLAVRPLQGIAQQRSCQNLIQEADQMYTRGNFDATIALLDECLDQASITESERRIAYRLKGLTYIGKGLEEDARASIRRLLQLVPNYEPDPIEDPPNFVNLITEIRADIQQELEAQQQAAEQQAAEQQAAEEAAAAVAQAEEQEPPPPQQQPTVRRKKRRGWLWGALGVAVAGGAVAYLVTQQEPGSGGSISAPPPLP